MATRMRAALVPVGPSDPLVWCARQVSALAVLTLDRAHIAAARFARVATVAAAVTVVAMTVGAWGPGDIIKNAVANMLEQVSATVTNLSLSMLTGAFDGSLGSLGTAEWSVGASNLNKMAGVMTVVTVCVCMAQIIWSLIKGKPRGITRAVVGAALAWPVTATVAWLTVRLVGWFDALAVAMIEKSVIVEAFTQAFNLAFVTAAGGGPVGIGFMSVVFALLIWFPTLLLSLMLAFRSYALLVAFAAAPIAWMIFGWTPLKGLTANWAKVTAGLMLTKPVMALFIVIAIELIGVSPVGGPGALITGVMGLFMAAFSPAIAIGMVTGAVGLASAGSAVEHGASQGEAGARRAARSLAQKASRGANKHGSKYAEKAKNELFSRLADFSGKGRGRGGKAGEEAPASTKKAKPAEPSAATQATSTPAPKATESSQSAAKPENPSPTPNSAPKPSSTTSAAAKTGATVGSAVPVAGTVAGYVAGQALDKGMEAAKTAARTATQTAQSAVSDGVAPTPGQAAGGSGGPGAVPPPPPPPPPPGGPAPRSAPAPSGGDGASLFGGQ